MTNNDNDERFNQELRAIRSEREFHAFIERNASHPNVVKMFQMTKDKNPMQIAENLANSSKVDFAGLRSCFGF